MNVTDFIELGEEQAIRYDFFNESSYADNSILIKDIYKRVFPWYRDRPDYYSGDTINTYKRAIWDKERENQGRSDFVCLSSTKQDNYLDIVKRHTNYLPNHVFSLNTYTVLDKEESLLKREICNNHQLGNFWVLPLTKRNGSTLNTLKNSECMDYMDLILEIIKKIYENKVSVEPTKTEVVLADSSHFLSHFNNQFETFINKNFFTNYIENKQIIELHQLTFEDYTKRINDLIMSRGIMMYQYLKANQ